MQLFRVFYVIRERRGDYRGLRGIREVYIDYIDIYYIEHIICKTIYTILFIELYITYTIVRLYRFTICRIYNTILSLYKLYIILQLV